MKDKPLVCWDLVVLSMPAILAGKILGLMMNIIFPEWLIVLLFISVMINDFTGTLKYYLAIKSGKKAHQHCCGCSAPNPDFDDWTMRKIYDWKPQSRRGSLEIDFQKKGEA